MNTTELLAAMVPDEILDCDPQTKERREFLVSNLSPNMLKLYEQANDAEKKIILSIITQHMTISLLQEQTSHFYKILVKYTRLTMIFCIFLMIVNMLPILMQLFAWHSSK